MIRIATGLLATIAFGAAAHAAELRPMEAQSIVLGDVTGVAYYMVADDGYQVVATLAAGESSMPMRFVTTLSSGQKVVLSVPQAAGEQSKELEIARRGDAVFVTELAALMN
jgi:hypothetical protein